MLIIRDRQLRALARAALARWLVRHLNEYFPDECEELGPAGVRIWIQYGMERAAAHGFTSEDHVAQYLDLMFTLGRDFDTDPAFPWTTPILTDRTKSAAARMAELCQAALQQVGAPPDSGAGE